MRLFLLFFSAYAAHALQRVMDYMHPENADILGSFYQNYNMMKAAGSGQITGVGYGESLQKFNESIPEAISDSIFPIFAEE
ncbi:Cell division protein ftsW [sediment metagenome]|uniref:Cell division protein ftsW n=1 Tax=sediment metagenome TaxID=749907 RepID=D9PG40_9ZZZZ